MAEDEHKHKGVRANVPLQRILAPNAGPMTGAGTNSYLLGATSLALIDPGPADQEHIHAMIDSIGERRLDYIFVTHTHADHSPAAEPLRRLTGASLIGLSGSGAGQDQTFRPDGNWHDGDRVKTPEWTLQLVHTPGHVSNHLCYLLEEEGLLFTGDHVLQGTTSVILPPDGDMQAYMNSLDRLLKLPLALLAPGHGELMHDPRFEINKLVRHRQHREQKIVTALGDIGPSALAALTPVVYDDVASHLFPWAERTLLAHLIKLRAEGRAGEVDGAWSLM
ncbi:MAG: MBL fold metallo-hydrolase [Pseudohongiellaceae bacterium]